MFVPRGAGQVLGDEFAEALRVVQLTHQNQAAVGGDSRPLEIDLQRSVSTSRNSLGLLLRTRISNKPVQNLLSSDCSPLSLILEDGVAGQG